MNLLSHHNISLQSIKMLHIFTYSASIPLCTNIDKKSNIQAQHYTTKLKRKQTLSPKHDPCLQPWLHAEINTTTTKSTCQLVPRPHQSNKSIELHWNKGKFIIMHSTTILRSPQREWKGPHKEIHHQLQVYFVVCKCQSWAHDIGTHQNELDNSAIHAELLHDS